MSDITINTTDPSIVTVSEEVTVVTSIENETVIVDTTKTTIEVNVTSEPTVVVSTVGLSGAGSTASVVAGEDISVYSIVVVGNDGKGYLANPTNSSHLGKVLGVAIQSASNGNGFQYQSLGRVSGGTATPGTLYFVGLGGQLSSSPRAVGATWMQYIGVGIAASEFEVQLGAPTQL